MTTRCGSLAQAEWGINAIRLPMNEDCWLGLNRANPKTSGPVQHYYDLSRFSSSLINSNETFCMLKRQRELTLRRSTAAPTASSSAYV